MFESSERVQRRPGPTPAHEVISHMQHDGVHGVHMLGVHLFSLFLYMYSETIFWDSTPQEQIHEVMINTNECPL